MCICASVRIDSLLCARVSAIRWDGCHLRDAARPQQPQKMAPHDHDSDEPWHGYVGPGSRLRFAREVSGEVSGRPSDTSLMCWLKSAGEVT